MNKNKVIIKKYSGAPPYGHCFWLPGKNDHTFSCTETLLNTVTLLLRPRFFGLLVTVLTGFHCALLTEVVDVFSIIIENDRWWALFFPQSSVLRANSKMMQIDDKRRGPRQRAKNESYMQASLIRRGKRFWVSSSRKLGREEWKGEGRGGEKRKLFPQSPCEPAGLRDGTIIFLTGGGGGGGKFSHSNIVLYAAPAVNNFLVSPSSCKHIYLCLYTIYFSVFSLCKQLISKFSNPPPPPPRQKNCGPSLRVYPGCRGLF